MNTDLFTSCRINKTNVQQHIRWCSSASWPLAIANLCHCHHRHRTVPQLIINTSHISPLPLFSHNSQRAITASLVAFWVRVRGRKWLGDDVIKLVPGRRFTKTPRRNGSHDRSIVCVWHWPTYCSISGSHVTWSTSSLLPETLHRQIRTSVEPSRQFLLS